jgi:ubiquinone/menaquinone biosynthesis C-methylase UbiE
VIQPFARHEEIKMVSKNKVAEHYESVSLTERLKAALKAEGLDERRLVTKDLASLDHFHSRGLLATVELAQELDIKGSSRVLDIGSGLGGPSRYLAATYGCEVQGVDLSHSFVEAATYLAERSGLSANVSYLQGDALDLPFSAESFDIAWTQHVAMNIADRSAFYGEAFRVLRHGGHLAIFDVVSVPDMPLHYPLPWASTQEASFLMTAQAMRDLLLAHGFRVKSWHDTTDAGVAWFRAVKAARAEQLTGSSLNLSLAMGPSFDTATSNLARSLSEGHLLLIQATLEKL